MLSFFQTIFAPPRHMILLVIAAWVGMTLAEKSSARHRTDADQLNSLTFFSLIAFIIGGRLIFALQHISAFTKSPLGVFSINPDLFNANGALAAAALTALIYCQRNKLQVWSYLDALTPFFASLAVGLGLSHFSAGTAFGTTTNLPWAINLWNAQRHPTQLYETLVSLLILGLLLLNKKNHPPGIFFLIFSSLTAVSQLFIGAFRADLTLTTGGFKQEQIISLLILAVSFVLLEIRFGSSRSDKNKEKSL